MNFVFLQRPKITYKEDFSKDFMTKQTLPRSSVLAKSLSDDPSLHFTHLKSTVVTEDFLM